MHTRVRLTTIASTKALAGADLRFVQDWLGHAKIQNGIIYTFLTARTREQSARGATNLTAAQFRVLLCRVPF